MKIIFSHFIFIWIRSIVGGTISITTIDITYLVDKIGCETREIIVVTSNVPRKTNIDSHKTNRYSEKDFVKLMKKVKTIRL
jgi:hypothetical protein